jgi:hypothetical protein
VEILADHDIAAPRSPPARVRRNHARQPANCASKRVSQARSTPSARKAPSSGTRSTAAPIACCGGRRPAATARR